MIVVDVNVIAHRRLRTDRSRPAARVEQKDGFWIVPPLWRYEFQNILVTTVKQGKLTPSEAHYLWEETESALLFF